MRFPRLEKIRDDKSWSDCLDINELEKLRTMAQGKLSYQHTTASSEPAPKKRRTVTRVERPVTIAKHFATADVSLVKEVLCVILLECTSNEIFYLPYSKEH